MQTKSTVSFIFLCLLFGLTSALAQTGTIRGKVTDGTTGEVLLGATVRVVQDGQVKGGAYSDIEGAFTAKVPAGTYQILTSYISYLTDTAEVTVEAGQVSTLNVLLYEESTVREDLAVTITAKRDNASEVAFLAQKQNSINAIDGVTFDLVQRTGDANAAAAVQRVVGVTVEGGKYVYVRGLGDRYSKTMLNGSELPGLDPNRNTVQMDIFPSNLIDQIIVYKNFTPDLPGDFAGGLVDVRTKDFPDRLSVRASASVGYNDQASLNDDFLTNESFDGEWLGNSNEIRDLPSYIAEDLNGTLPRVPTLRSELATAGVQLEQATRSFQTGIEPIRSASGMNQRYEVSIGNQHLIGERPFGYIASLSYRRNFNYFADGTANQFDLPSAGSEALAALNLFSFEKGEDEILWGGLVKLSYKPFASHKFSVNYMHNQSGTRYAERYQGPFTTSGGDITLQSRVAGYIERSIDVLQVQGDHAFGPLRADWIASRTEVRQYEPDLRFFANEIELTRDAMGNPIDTAFNINNGNGYDNPLRFYRDLQEVNYDARLNFDLDIPSLVAGQEGALSFGGAYTTKDREFSENRFEYFRGGDADTYNGSIDAYLADSNLISVPLDGEGEPIASEYFEGIYLADATRATNIFDADQVIAAGYLMVEMPLTDRLKTIIGARYERTDAEIIPEDSTLFEPLRVENPDVGRLDLNDVLPSVNLIYDFSPEMKLRGGYSRTLARPTVIELSPFQRLPYIGGPEVLGNPNLVRTLIDNADLRWEWFFSLNELFSVSAFYKNFENPIGLALDNRTANLRFQYQNRERALVTGAEIELKKHFGFIGAGFEKLLLTANASFVYSETELLDEELEIIRTVDPDRSTIIPLFGQSPYVVNAELAYIDKEDLGLQVSGSFNVFGPRLYAIGNGAPDIYEQPRPSVNFSISKDLGKYLAVRFRANNLLNPRYFFTQDFKGTEYVFQEYRVGRRFSLGLSFRLNS